MDVKAYFDGRAEGYPHSGWHRRYAEALVRVAGPAPGDRVLDAATGTGFAAVAAARAVGPSGAVVGVDISGEMLAQAVRTRTERPRIAYVIANANDMRCFAAGTFDLVLCSAGLLYLDHRRALPAWRHVLRPGGRLAFSTMRAGYPVGAALFRELAGEYGCHIPDPSAPLGDEARCAEALADAGYVPEHLVTGTVRLPATDPYEQWRLHRYGSRRAELDTLPSPALTALEERFLTAIRRHMDHDPDRTLTARVLYATATVP